MTYNGRGAIFQVLRSFPSNGRRNVLVPAFHCPSVVDPVLAAGYTPRFYRITPDLRIDIQSVADSLDATTAAIIVINYFGFPAATQQLRDLCQAAGVTVIEDCAHSFMLSDPVELSGESSATCVYSFKKLLPTMVGGGIRSHGWSGLPRTALQPPPLSETVINCKRLLEQAIQNMKGGAVRESLLALERVRVNRKRKRLGLPSETTEAQVTQFEYPFDEDLAKSRMPWYARRILLSSDLALVASARQRNYRFWLENIPYPTRLRPIYAEVPPRIVPWAFPVHIEARSEIDKLLRQSGVPVFTFGETLHPSFLDSRSTVDRATMRIAIELSKTVLCLPVQQGLPTHLLSNYCSGIQRVMQQQTHCPPRKDQ